MNDRAAGSQDIPLILYSPVSWFLVFRMLRTEVALEPTVSTFSKPGAVSGRWFSSWTTMLPGRRAKGLRIGMVDGWMDR